MYKIHLKMLDEWPPYVQGTVRAPAPSNFARQMQKKEAN